MIIVSDIHMHRKKAVPMLLGRLRDAVCNDDHKILIIAGDLTCKAKQEEYEAVSEWFGELRENGVNIIAAAGNHDTSKSIGITRIRKEKGFERYAGIAESIARQPIVVARRDDFDMIYKVDKDVFFAARSTHHRLRKPTRVKRKQFEWAKLILKQEGLLPENGYRLHLVTHQSIWRLRRDGEFEGDKHNHMNNRKRLRKEFLEPLGFSTAINGHNHNFTEGMRTIKGYQGYQIYHIQAPTLS